MEVMILGGNALRVKGKNSTLVINPSKSTSKIEADAIISLSNSDDFSDSKVEGFRITIKGHGEYEIGGAKVSALKVAEKLVVRIDIDNVKVLVGSGGAIEKVQEKVEDSDILVVDADEKFNYSTLTTMEPKVLLVYGDLKDEVSKSIGKENVEKLNKFSTTADKLPTELQYVILA